MTVSRSVHTLDPSPAEELELLECLRKIDRGLIASGSPVGVIEKLLGVFLGSLIVSPKKFIPVQAQSDSMQGKAI
jgi:hypothetical protein